MATIFIFFIVIYFQGWKIEIPLRHLRVRGYESTLSVKLFYTSSTPIILQTAMVGHVYFLSEILYKRY
jgi:protein transport protein SEC61 subunit alpha